MISILLIAIIGVLAVPSYQFTLERLLLNREITSLRQGLALDQHLASISRQPVSICASSDNMRCGEDWSKGFIISSRAPSPQPPAPPPPHQANNRSILWVHHNSRPQTIKISFNRGNIITFNSKSLSPSPFGSFTITAASGRLPASKLVINRLGRVRVQGKTKV